MESFNRQRLLDIRAHLRIAHHVPGRIRLRIVPTILSAVRGLDSGLLKLPFAELAGIHAARINPFGLSAVVDYDAETLPPDWWETALEGSDDEVLDLSDCLQELWGETIGAWKTRAIGARGAA